MTRADRLRTELGWARLDTDALIRGLVRPDPVAAAVDKERRLADAILELEREDGND